MPQRSYGWVKDPHNPQAVYHLPKKLAIPLLVNYLQYCPPVRNQGSVGSCTGHGIGGMAYTVAKMGKFDRDIFSPTWLYNGARDLEGTLAQDAGANPDDVFAWATLYGLLEEHYWPYDPTKLDKSAPGSTRMAQAIKFPDFQAIRVDNGIDGIISALADGHCVAVGGPFPQEWEAGSKDTLPIPTAASVIAGGHEMFYFGGDQSKAFFNDQNSWGPDWSDGGRCKIPFEYIDWAKNHGGYDAHYIVMTAPVGPPTPPPAPPKKRCWFR